MQNLRYYCRQRIEALADKCNANLARFEHIIVQGANKISHDSLSYLKSYSNEKILYQRTVIHIFLQHEGNAWILLICETVKVYKLKIL